MTFILKLLLGMNLNNLKKHNNQINIISSIIRSCNAEEKKQNEIFKLCQSVKVYIICND